MENIIFFYADLSECFGLTKLFLVHFLTEKMLTYKLARSRLSINRDDRKSGQATSGSFLTRIPLVANPARCLLAFLIVSTDRGPEKG